MKLQSTGFSSRFIWKLHRFTHKATKYRISLLFNARPPQNHKVRHLIVYWFLLRRYLCFVERSFVVNYAKHNGWKCRCWRQRNMHTCVSSWLISLLNNSFSVNCTKWITNTLVHDQCECWKSSVRNRLSERRERKSIRFQVTTQNTVAEWCLQTVFYFIHNKTMVPCHFLIIICSSVRHCSKSVQKP